MMPVNTEFEKYPTKLANRLSWWGEGLLHSLNPQHPRSGVYASAPVGHPRTVVEPVWGGGDGTDGMLLRVIGLSRKSNPSFSYVPKIALFAYGPNIPRS